MKERGTCRGINRECDRRKSGFGWFLPKSPSNRKFLGMDTTAPETDLLKGLADGIHHGRWPTDKDGRVAAALRKELLQHGPIEATGCALEIPLPRHHVVYRKVRQLGFDGIELLAA